MMIVAAALLIAIKSGSLQPETRPTTKDVPMLRLNAAQMFRLAELAQAKSDLATEFAIYTALEINPDSYVRAEARFRHAKRLLELKRNREAALLLRRVVDEKPDALSARLQLARALQLLGDTNAALRELRAAQSAGLPPTVAQLIDRYSTALRAQRSYGASFEFALAPDSNINRATRSDTLGTVFGDFHIADDAKAKSGTGVSLNGQAFRRFSIGGDADVLFRLSGFADVYRQSSFNNIAVDLAAGPELNLGRGRLQIELGATQRWYGQKPYIRSERLAATFAHALGSRTLLRLSGSAAMLDNQISDLQDGKSYSARFQLERALTPTTGIAPSLSFDRQALNEPGYATTGWRAGLTGWHDVGRMTFTAGMEMGRTRGDAKLLLFPEARRDRYSRLSIAASFRQIEYGGFAPVIRFSIERNRSNIAFDDYRRARTEFAMVRAF